MSTINAVAPWEGLLHWIGVPTEGVSQNTGNPWKRVDFTLKYVDHQMREKFIVFSLSGPDKVNRLLATPLGTTLRVTWLPDANNYTDTSGAVKWFPKYEAIGFYAVQAQPQSGTQVQQNPAAPQYPPQNGGFVPNTQNVPQQPQFAQPQYPQYPQNYPPQYQQPTYQDNPGDLPPGLM